MKTPPVTDYEKYFKRAGEKDVESFSPALLGIGLFPVEKIKS